MESRLWSLPVLCAFLSLACGSERAAPRLVILYATCTVNAGYLSPYDPSIPYTPNLAKFARSATVFERHHSESGQSGISFAAIFTGSQADRHGVYHHPTRLSEDQTLIAEAYAADGWDSYYWNGHPMASASLGYAQGVPRSQSFHDPRRPFDGLKAGDAEMARIAARLDAEPDYRALLVTNFTVTHGPYSTQDLQRFLARYPQEANGLTWAEIAEFGAVYRNNRHQLQWNFPETAARLKLDGERLEKLVAVIELLYKSRIHELDRIFGELIDEIEDYGLLDESLIVVTSDHGEILYREHSTFKWEHGFVMLPEVLRVPLLIRGPDGPPGPPRWPGVTRSIDLFPTMAGLSRVRIPSETQIEGIDLSDSLRGVEEAPRLLAFSHSTTTIPAMRERRRAWSLMEALFPSDDVEWIWTTVRQDDLFVRWRHTGGGDWRFEAFDLETDPHASVDVYSADDPVHRELSERLASYKRLLVRSSKGESSSPLEDEALERLRALGYVE